MSDARQQSRVGQPGRTLRGAGGGWAVHYDRVEIIQKAEGTQYTRGRR